MQLRTLKQLAFAGGVGLTLAVFASPSGASMISASADTWVERGRISGALTPAFDRTGETRVKTRDNGTNNNARSGILRFDVSSLTVTASSGSSLVLELGGASSGSVGTIFLWGVAPNAGASPVTPSELTFADSGFVDSDADAADQSGNGVNETYIFDGDPVAANIQPLGTLGYNRSTDPNGTLYTFTGSALDDYLTSQLAASASDVAFVVTIQRAQGNSNDNRVEFTSTDESGGNAPTLTVIPEPASVALLALGAVTMLGRSRRTN